MATKIISVITLSIFAILIAENSYAMHIMEGYLPMNWALIWYVAAAPFIVYGVYKVKQQAEQSSKYLVLLALCGAFAFVLSALKLPSFTGSCSHPTGIGLGAMLFGVGPMSIIGALVLLFQSLFLAHGGISTLGANVFSMAIVGAVAGYYSYHFLKSKIGFSAAVFIAAFLADILAYITTSFQIAIAFAGAENSFMALFAKFLSIFAVTQLPLAVTEALLTLVVMNILVKYSPKEMATLKLV